jgi:hypothetical protein
MITSFPVAPQHCTENLQSQPDSQAQYKPLFLAVKFPQTASYMAFIFPILASYSPLPQLIWGEITRHRLGKGDKLEKLKLAF